MPRLLAAAELNRSLLFQSLRGFWVVFDLVCAWIGWIAIKFQSLRGFWVVFDFPLT
jgi:hypothetical protein